MKNLRTLSLAASDVPAGGSLFAVTGGKLPPSAPDEAKAFAATGFDGAAGSAAWVVGAARPTLLAGLGDGSPAAVRAGYACSPQTARELADIRCGNGGRYR
ncbi:MAG: hypothetical protein IJS32_02680 [Kiritimatiellae bacterium]|nr:hypothetical protein [Kiritimatiellia bacterium]